MSTSFRAGIMLAVFVGLPAAWVYYGPLPPHAQRVVDRLVAAAKEATGWEHSAQNRTEGSAVEAPAFVIGNAPAIPAMAPSAANGAAMNPPARLPAPTSTTIAGGQAMTLNIEPLLARLRELGAATYVLEPWGAGQKLFRFRCEMPLGASDAMTQQFEAIAPDPAASVAQVVAEVSSWQLARAGTTALR